MPDSPALLYKKMSYISPIAVMALLWHHEGVILLDSSSFYDNEIASTTLSAKDYYSEYSFIVFAPLATYNFKRWHKVHDKQLLKELLKQNQNLKEACAQIQEPLPPFVGGLVGYFSYELGHALENIVAASAMNNKSYSPYYDQENNFNSHNSHSNHTSDCCLGVYNKVFAFDHVRRCCYLIASSVAGYVCNLEQELSLLVNIYSQVLNDNNHVSSTHKTLNGLQCAPTARYLQLNQYNSNQGCNYHYLSRFANMPLHLRPNYSQKEYHQVVAQAVHYIKEGDIFEVNLAQQFCTHDVPAYYNAWELYLNATANNNAPMAAFLNLQDIQIISTSPERFMRIYNGQHIEVKPIKGTIRRDFHDIKLNAALKAKLQQSEKNQAENIMIVDLMRNDLAKVCTMQSVHVRKLCEVLSFANVHHLVSTIEGDLSPEYDVIDALLACFPAGSITGAPKIRAMEIIHELERAKRGVYCGAIGYIGFNGEVDLSVSIRTLTAKLNKWRQITSIDFATGGAITLDSCPEDEYEETMLKAARLIHASCSVCQ